MDNSAQAANSQELQIEIEKTISELIEFRGSLKVRLGIVDDRIIQFTDALKKLESLLPCVEKKFTRRIGTTLVQKRAAALEPYLRKLGADKAWISLSFTQIAKEFQWPLNSIRPVIEYLAQRHGLSFRVGHLGVSSRFTFSDLEWPEIEAETSPQPAPKPAPKQKPPIKRAAVKIPQASTPKQLAPVQKTAVPPKPKTPAVKVGNVEVEDALLEKLYEIGAKVGTSSFSIPIKNLVRHVGYSSAQIVAAMDALAANGEILITKIKKPAQEYFLKISEAE